MKTGVDPSLIRLRIRYLIARRSLRELELLLHRFWERHGPMVSDEDLPDAEKIVAMDDHELFEILLGGKPPPKGYRLDLFELLRDKELI